MLNETHTPDVLRVIATYPAVPAAGGVVIYGDLVGVAEGAEDAAGYTVTQFGPFVGTFSVTDTNTGGIAKGAPIFASKATPVVLSNLATGVFFGWANAVVTTGATATIEVIKAGYAGGVLGASAVGTTQIADSSVTGAKLLIPNSVGTSSVPITIDTPDEKGLAGYFSTLAASGTTYAQYFRLDVLAAGLEAIAGRSKVLLKIAGVANAHGRHDTLELDTSAGSVTGLATGHRANLVLPARALPAGGEYFGAMSEIYIPASGSVAAVTRAAIHEFSTGGQDATAEKTVKNWVSIDTGSTGTGNMVVTATDASPDWTGSIRIIVNGTPRYLHFTDAEAS
jgi:hypothetical protein